MTSCLEVGTLSGWLFTIDSRKVSPLVREKLVRYQRECGKVLGRHFFPDAASVALLGSAVVVADDLPPVAPSPFPGGTAVVHHMTDNDLAALRYEIMHEAQIHAFGAGKTIDELFSDARPRRADVSEPLMRATESATNFVIETLMGVEPLTDRVGRTVYYNAAQRGIAERVVGIVLGLPDSRLNPDLVAGKLGE